MECIGTICNQRIMTQIVGSKVVAAVVVRKSKMMSANHHDQNNVMSVSFVRKSKVMSANNRNKRKVMSANGHAVLTAATVPANRATVTVDHATVTEDRIVAANAVQKIACPPPCPSCSVGSAPIAGIR